MKSKLLRVLSLHALVLRSGGKNIMVCRDQGNEHGAAAGKILYLSRSLKRTHQEEVI